jgi:hypothetical protein
MIMMVKKNDKSLIVHDEDSIAISIKHRPNEIEDTPTGAVRGKN